MTIADAHGLARFADLPISMLCALHRRGNETLRAAFQAWLDARRREIGEGLGELVVQLGPVADAIHEREVGGVVSWCCERQVFTAPVRFSRPVDVRHLPMHWQGTNYAITDDRDRDAVLDACCKASGGWADFARCGLDWIDDARREGAIVWRH